MPYTILFVDDEFSPDTETSLGSYMSYYDQDLREAGFSVERVADADEAIRLVREKPFDLALLDVLMPPGNELRGEETLKGLLTGIFLSRRLHEIRPEMPIIFLSNLGERRDLFRGVLADGVVRKVLFKLDVTPMNLVDEVRSAFEQ